MQHEISSIWKSFFDGDHQSVVQQASKTLSSSLAADFLHVSGLSLLSTGNVEEGITRLRASVCLSPIHQWFNNAAITTLGAGAVSDSLWFAKTGLVKFPNEPTLHFAHGNALMASGALDDALTMFKTALVLDPSMDDVKLNMGNCYRRMNQGQKALECYDAALREAPNHTGALINKVGCQMEMGDDRSAETVLVKLLADTNIPEVAFMLALIRLADGDFTDGWELYRRRWECSMAAPDRNKFTKPIIPALSDARGKHLLVEHEQGFGDSLQFVRYASMLLDHAAKVTICVPSPLVRLFQLIDTRIEVVSSQKAAEPYDFEVPMLDLPALLETTVETIPATIPYLSVPDDVMAQRKLAPKGSGNRVGLVWAGQMRPNPDLAAVDRRRSLNLAQLEPLFSVPFIEFVSLQMGEPSRQIAEVPFGYRMALPLENGFDFLDTAAIIKQLDLVITVDTAVAHLAAGLGVKTWVLSRYDGCWRWLRNRDDSPWYPGVFHLFRQRAQHDWSFPIEEMTKALASLSG